MENPSAINLLLSRFSGLFANGLLILALPYYFDSIVQGYYFAFLGFAAFQVAFDFGMSQTILQLVIHASTNHDDRKVIALIEYANTWFKRAAIIFIAILLPLGLWYFGNSSEQDPHGWQITWAVLVILTGINLYLLPKITVIEGLGGIGRVAVLRTTQNFVGIFLVFIGLHLNFGLVVILIFPAVSALFTYVFIERIYIFQNLTNANHQISNADKKEVFNLQWKIGLSWICGYVVQQSITPIIFREHGASLAGKFGLTLALFNAISIIGLSWVAACAPNFAVLAARYQRENLINIFKRSMIKTVLSTVFLVCALLMLLGYSNIIPSDRVASGTVLACLAAVCLANSIIFPIAMLLRAHKQEPTLIAGVVTSLMLIGLVLSIAHQSVEAIAVAYAATTLLLAMPWTILVGLKFIKNYYAK